MSNAPWLYHRVKAELAGNKVHEIHLWLLYKGGSATETFKKERTVQVQQFRATIACVWLRDGENLCHDCRAEILEESLNLVCYLSELYHHPYCCRKLMWATCQYDFSDFMHVNLQINTDDL